MSHYLSRLVERHVNDSMPVLQPRIPSRFEDLALAHNHAAQDAPTETTFSAQPAAGDSSTLKTPDSASPPIEQANTREPSSGPAISNTGAVALPSHVALAPRVETHHSHYHFSTKQLEVEEKKPEISTGPRLEPPASVRVTLLPTKPQLLEKEIESGANVRDEVSLNRSTERVPFRNQQSVETPSKDIFPIIVSEPQRVDPSNRETPTIAAESLPRRDSDSNTVHVSIGRIEIRTPVQKQEPRKSPSNANQARIMTLNEYVRQKTGGVR